MTSMVPVRRTGSDSCQSIMLTKLMMVAHRPAADEMKNCVRRSFAFPLNVPSSDSAAPRHFIPRHVLFCIMLVVFAEPPTDKE